MESYFSQILSRHAAPMEYLQPVSAPPQFSVTDIEWKPFTDTAQIIDRPAAGYSLPVQPGDAVSEYHIENKTSQHQYLQQYFQRTLVDNQLHQHLSLMDTRKPGANLPFSTVEQVVSVIPADHPGGPPDVTTQPPTPEQPKNTVTLLTPEHNIQDTATKISPVLPAATWLLPAEPAAMAPQPAAVAPPVTAALTIGKILIEILPVKTVPPRTAHRPSPFQLTGNTGKSAGSGFGLGQL